MSVTSIASPQQYGGNGVTTVFAFPYKFLSNSDIVVLTTIAGVDALLVQNTDYSVAGAGLDAGGSVTIFTAPANGTVITIFRDTSRQQQVDYVAQDNFPAETHETALDRLTLQSQDMAVIAARCLRLPRTTPVLAQITLAQCKGKILGFDANGVPAFILSADALQTLLLANPTGSFTNIGLADFGDLATGQALKRRRGTTTEHQTFTGQLGEITVDTTLHTPVVHDGVTAGGFPVAVKGVVRPEWFGQNLIPGTTDMTAAFQAAITFAVANNIQTIELAADTYYLATPVVFNSAARGWRITGKSTPGWLGIQNGTILRGPNGLAAMFLFSAAQAGVEIDHIAFNGTNSATGVVSAIKMTAEGQPARPFNIHHCHFINFDRTIYSLLIAGGGNTGTCQININYNVFYVNTYALYGAGDVGSLMDVDFSGNVSEQGGRIKVLNGGAAGTWRIVSNLMEGQSDSIDISASLCQLVFENNYFESNTGYLCRFSASNGGSQLFVRGNRYLATTAARIEPENCEVICEDRLTGKALFSGSSLTGNSRFAGCQHVLSTLGTETSFSNCLDLSVVNGKEFDLVGVTGTLRLAGASNFAQTPHGLRSYERFNTNSSTFSVLTDLAVGDWVIVTALVRQINATAQTIVGVIYDNAIAYLGECSPMSPFESGNQDGGWKLIHFGVKVAATSTGNHRVRFATQAGGIVEVADFFAYRTALADNTAPIHIMLPSSSKMGQATLLSGNTSIVVTHGMLVTPSIVTPTPQKNCGACYVDTITSTQFTIHTTVAAPSDTVIMWSAH